MYSLVSLVGLIVRRVRGIRGAKVVVADVDVGCGRTAGAVRYLVETVDCLSSGGNSKQNGLLCLRECRQAIMGLAGDVHGVAQVDDGGASRDNDRIVGESGGKGEGGGGSLIRVCIGAALFPSVLLCLASSGVLAMVCLLLLLLASLLLLQQPIPPLLLLSLLLLLQWLLLLLLELEVPWIVLNGTDFASAKQHFSHTF